jgi:Transposase DDE domain
MKKLRQGKYKVKNWSEYNKSLKNRGDITFWLSDDALGRLLKYSKIALQTIYTFRQIFNLCLRQAEGFTRYLLRIVGVSLPIPDYTTVSRRIRKLPIDLVYSKPSGNINIIFASTDIKVLGEKEWINYKHGTRQRKIWRKLHIGVTDEGNIIAGEITTLRDIATVPELLKQIPNYIDNIVGDGAYHQKRML